MTALLAQRQLALAGIALLGAIFAIALNIPHSPSSATPLPQSVPAPGGGWFTALASGRGPTFGHVHRDRACRRRVGPGSLGLAHPVLPCNAKIYIEYRGRLALTQVLARSAYAPGRDFEVSPALAAKLHLSGTQQIQWRYAR